MRLIGVVKFHNEEEHLERCLKSLKGFCNEICCYDAESTDNSRSIALKYTDKIITDKNDFNNESRHRQVLLNLAIANKADWIFWLDADEVVEEGGGKEIRKLCENRKGFESFSFNEINLWRSEQWYRVDNMFGDGWFNRLWRNNGRLFYDITPGLHQPPQPKGLFNAMLCDVRIIHYGFSTFDRIIKKIQMYKKWGMKVEEFKRFYDESTLELEPLLKEVTEHKPKKLEEKVWISYLK